MFLEFKWTTSRGQDTYGYNICSLWVDGYKRSSCMGGGYDMQGTAYGDWLEKDYQDRLKRIHYKSHTTVSPDAGYQARLKEDPPGNLYGMTSYYDKNGTVTKVHLDGACGMRAMEDVGDAIGIKLTFQRRKRSDNTVYFAEDTSNAR